MRRSVLFIVAVIAALSAGAQRGKVAVQVKNDQQAALENVTVELLRAKDSVLVKTALSDKAGLAELDNVVYGEFIVRAGMVNMTTTHSAPFVISAGQPELRLPAIILQPKATGLAAVTVNARKPFIQRLSDRIVVNVENSIISAGSSAIDVLERSPGVNIDQNDIISLRGRSGVIVMIDGKPTAMAGADLANYLRSLPSASIERIDIITNPSAKYDAAGNSGIIDIRMKKDQRFGYNGTFTAGYGQGKYPKANAGTTFNYRNKKVNLFGNYNYAYRVGLNHLILDRNFYNNGIYNGGDLKDNYSKSPFSSNTARIGMDFFPSAKTIFGFVVNGNFNHFRRNNDNQSKVIDANHQQISTFNSLATNNDHGNNVVANVNFKHRFDSTGREITADVDYGQYRSNSLSTNATRYYKMDGSTLQPDYVLNGDQEGRLTLRTAKIDYVNPLKNGGKFEAGMKTSFVSADNNAKFFDVSSGSPVNDVNKTNHFLYDESNHAALFELCARVQEVQFATRTERGTDEHRNLPGNGQTGFRFQLFPAFPERISELQDQ